MKKTTLLLIFLWYLFFAAYAIFLFAFPIHFVSDVIEKIPPYIEFPFYFVMTVGMVCVVWIVIEHVLKNQDIDDDDKAKLVISVFFLHLLYIPFYLLEHRNDKLKPPKQSKKKDRAIGESRG